MKKTEGFTLAELLVVVAIIGVLVAVSIPIFTSQLDKAKVATNQANIRAAKVAASADYISYPDATYALYAYDITTGSFADISKVTGAYFKDTYKDPKLKYRLIYTRLNDVNKACAQLVPRLSEPYIKNGIYQYIAVYVSQNEIKTFPYYDAVSKKIVEDVG